VVAHRERDPFVRHALELELRRGGAVRVLDRVRAGLAGRDQDLEHRLGIDAQLGEPASQRRADRPDQRRIARHAERDARPELDESHREDGRVVGHAPAGERRPDHVLAQAVRIARPLGDGLPELLEAALKRRVPALDDPVRVQDKGVAGAQHVRRLVEPSGGDRAERDREPLRPELHRAVGPEDERRRVARVHDAERPGGGVEQREDERRERDVRVAPVHQPVQLPHHVGRRRVAQRVRPDGVAELTHERRRGDPAPDHVPHHDRDR
jgi:hypothetical protein